ncbi:hypothetical protein [Alkalihalophilus marmarensis]|uniref:hypothetical protein n=1 Tax=Alkalihalophilus marmarensis TaxID=521377 RepID=UPI002E236253|nr:hypothetical protein [Alkalihalophilus marmarensis]
MKNIPNVSVVKMNLANLYKLIEAEFKVIKKEKSVISIGPENRESYPETTIKLTLDEGNNQYELFEVIRGKEYLVDTFTDKYKSVLALYIFSKSKLEVRNYDTNYQNDIESAKTLNDIQNIFKDNHEVQHYSFFELKPNKIILEKSTNDRYNILFLGKNRSKVYIEKLEI